MDSMKAYFECHVVSFCGIPEVRLEGTHEDWVRLAKKTEKLVHRKSLAVKKTKKTKTNA